MLSKLLSMRNKKGFTLIEIIIVLIILAVIAAIAIPSMIGFINQARDSQLIADARSALLAGQVVATKMVGQGITPSAAATGTGSIVSHPEFWPMLTPDGITEGVVFAGIEGGRVTQVTYTKGGRSVTINTLTGNTTVN